MQYNASVSQPMARNIGESMGTGADYALLDRYGNPLPPDQRFRSTAILENLNTIEHTLLAAAAAAWNEDVLGQDRSRRRRRAARSCSTSTASMCHGPHIAPPATQDAQLAAQGAAIEPEWIMKMLCVDDIGTDPNTALNFYDAKVDLTKTGLTADDLRAVARKELTILATSARRRCLQAEIARLKGTSPGNGARIAALQKQLDGPRRARWPSSCRRSTRRACRSAPASATSVC